MTSPKYESPSDERTIIKKPTIKLLMRIARPVFPSNKMSMKQHKRKRIKRGNNKAYRMLMRLFRFEPNELLTDAAQMPETYDATRKEKNQAMEKQSSSSKRKRIATKSDNKTSTKQPKVSIKESANDLLGALKTSPWSVGHPLNLDVKLSGSNSVKLLSKSSR